MAACGSQPVGFGGTGLSASSFAKHSIGVGFFTGMTTYDGLLRPRISRLAAARLAEARLLSANLKADLLAASFMNK